MAMDDRIRNALETDRVIDITTSGRQSGEPRRIEIWFHIVGGRIYITGSPGTRDWYANLLADPAFTFHLKGSTQADLPARARPITDGAERQQVLRGIVEGLGRDADLDAWLEGAPLVEVTFDGAD
jgi:deazaflavin-dependent oxidoreductase (nitroreductase family)